MTDHELAVAAACAGQMLRLHSPDSSTVLHEMMSWPPTRMHDIISKI